MQQGVRWLRGLLGGTHWIDGIRTGLDREGMQLVTLQYHARLYRSARWLMLLRCSASPVG